MAPRRGVLAVRGGVVFVHTPATVLNRCAGDDSCPEATTWFRAALAPAERAAESLLIRAIGHQLPLQVAPIETGDGSSSGRGDHSAGAEIGRDTRVGAVTAALPTAPARQPDCRRRPWASPARPDRLGAAVARVSTPRSPPSGSCSIRQAEAPHQ